MQGPHSTHPTLEGDMLNARRLQTVQINLFGVFFPTISCSSKQTIGSFTIQM